MSRATDISPAGSATRIVNHSLHPLRLAVFAALAFTASTATIQAQFFLVENVSGSFSADSTLGGVAFGSDQPFTLSATFDASAGTLVATGAAYFSTTTFTLNLPGYGTYTGDPVHLSPLLLDPSNTVFAGLTFAGMGFDLVGSSFTSGIMLPAYITTTPVLDVTAPAPTVFFDYIGSAAFAFSLPLSGVPGGLQVTGASGPVSANITAAVPEPAEYAAVAGLALGAFALTRRGRPASAVRN